MKSRVLISRALLLCTLVVASAITLYAQSFSAIMSDPSVMLGLPSSSLEHRGMLRNTSASAKKVIVRYFNQSTHPSHFPSMCTADLCYGLPNDFLQQAYDLPVFTLAGGDSIALKAIVNPASAEGTSTLVFTIFDQENPTDSIPYQMTFNFNNANSVKDLNEVADVLIAPNPSSDRVSISASILTQATNIDVYTANGQLLSTQRHDGSQRSVVNVSALPTGSYHIVVTLATGVIYRTPITVVR